MSGSGAAGFVDDVARWRQGVGDRAPSYRRLLGELAALLEGGSPEGAAVAARLEEAWATRAFQIFYERPLLLVAALRLDALARGPRHPLWEALGAATPDPASVTREALLAALSSEAVWRAARTRYVQTNETSRAVAWLWPARIIGADEAARPLSLFEVGAAAGLNLIADLLPAVWTDAAGAPLEVVRAPELRCRRGIDAAPLDPRRDEDADWLRACVWAGEAARLLRLDAALAAFRTAPAEVQRGDVTEAPDALRALGASRPAAGIVLAFQTIVRDYLPDSTRGAYERGMTRWIHDAPEGSALWVELEIDHADPERHAPITAHAREGDRVVELVLGRTGFHPASVEVDHAAVARLAALFGAPAPHPR